MDDEQHLDWQSYHDRIIAGDPTAFAELCEIALPILLADVKRRFPNQDDHLLATLVEDSLLKYIASPGRYDPTRGPSLRAYFNMDIRGDVLNVLAKQRREAKRLDPLDDEAVELRGLARNNIQEESEFDEWLQAHTDLDRDALLEQVAAELTPMEQAIALAMAEGVRKTEAFATLMGIDHLPMEEQRRQVKRAKDRVTKKLERFGKRKKRW